MSNPAHEALVARVSNIIIDQLMECGAHDRSRAILALVREALSEPTPEMVEAWENATEFPDNACAMSDQEINGYAATRDFNAMLAASPLSPGDEK